MYFDSFALSYDDGQGYPYTPVELAENPMDYVNLSYNLAQYNGYEYPEDGYEPDNFGYDMEIDCE